MNNNEDNDDGYERKVPQIEKLTISDDKVYDQKDHDQKKAPQIHRESVLCDQQEAETIDSSQTLKDYELDPLYRAMSSTIRCVPGTIGGFPSEQTIQNEYINTKSSSTVEREVRKIIIRPPAPPSTYTETPMKVNHPPMTVKEESTKTGKTQSKQHYSVPNEPFYTSPSTQFSTKCNPVDIKAKVEAMFNLMPGISYEFFHEKFRWEGVYLVSTMRCKFELNVYRRSNGDNIVEGNRLSGDSIAFVTVYQAVYDLFATKPARKSKWTAFGPSPPTKRMAVARDEVESIKFVTAMAASPYGEAKKNSAEILSNMASDPSKHKLLVENDCVPLLIQLMKFEFQSCDQFATIALAQLSEYPPCRDMLSKNKEFLELLFPLCSTDGNYNSTEKRRQCAQLLANISSAVNGAHHVVTSVDHQHVKTFLESVDELRDLKQRDFAFIAKHSLAACT